MTEAEKTFEHYMDEIIQWAGQTGKRRLIWTIPRCTLAREVWMELHDQRKAELQRIEKLGDFPSVTFDEACMRWLEEKAHKKSLDADKGRMGFWLIHFEGVLLKDITEAKIYTAVSRMNNRKSEERWKQRAAGMQKKGIDMGVYKPEPVSTSTKAKHLALMKALMRAAERDWKWIEKGPVIKVPQERKMRVDSNTAWRAALVRAGIEDFRFHDLRHTWASWLIQAGVPLSALQEMGGWESIEMVQRYAHLAPNHLTEHARHIDAIYSASVPNLSHKENLKSG